MISALLRFLCFLWRIGERGGGFSSPASSWVLFFAWPSGAFVSIAESPVIFQRLLCTTILPVVLLTQHILQELMSKRLSVVEFGCVLWCCSPSKSFLNRDLILLLKSGYVGCFGHLFDFGGLEWEKRMPWVFLTTFPCEYCFFWQISVIWQKSIPRCSSD